MSIGRRRALLYFSGGVVAFLMLLAVVFVGNSLHWPPMTTNVVAALSGIVIFEAVRSRSKRLK
jgi:putative flippase GtrA